MSDTSAMAQRFRGYLPVVVDLETGGFDPSQDAILELAGVVLCVYSEDGVEKQFFLANDCSTLNPVEYSDHLSMKLRGGSYVDVTTKKLSTLIEENNIDMNQYDFLNIDAEGAELEILKGFEDNLKYINMIFLETSLDDRNNTGASHDVIVEWLKERNFSLAEMSDSYQDERWGDSIFLRNDRELEPFNKEKYLLK